MNIASLRDTIHVMRFKFLAPASLANLTDYKDCKKSERAITAGVPIDIMLLAVPIPSEKTGQVVRQASSYVPILENIRTAMKARTLTSLVCRMISKLASAGSHSLRIGCNRLPYVIHFVFILQGREKCYNLNPTHEVPKQHQAALLHQESSTSQPINPIQRLPYHANVISIQ